MKRILTAVVLGSLLSMLVLPVAVSAQEEEIPEACTIRANFTFEDTPYEKGDTVDKSNPNWGIICLLNTIYTATNWLFMIIMLIAVIMIVVGGFTYMTASGDPEKAGKGKTIIVYALIGIAIALFAKVLPSIIRFIMGV